MPIELWLFTMNSTSLIPKTTLGLALTGLLLAGVNAAAVTIDFDTASDFESNFWAPTNRTLTEWQSSGDIQKDMPSSDPTTLVYNTNATGGGSGFAGTAGNAPYDTFANFTYEVDVAMSEFGPGNSVGLYTNLNNDADLGNIVFFRFNNGSSQADFRVFTGVDPTASNGIGSGSQVDAQNMASLGNFSTDTYYTFRLDVEDVGSDLQYTASVWTTDASPSQIGNTVSYTIVGGATGLSQVGLRLSTANGDSGFTSIDNYSITNIPEPGHWAAMLSGLVGLGLLLRRRK